MIENLEGIHETVNYTKNTHIRLYDNSETENYPAHWHKPPEIIMPLEGNYYIQINNTSYVLHPFEISFICPGVIHKLDAPAAGRRIIFQPDLSAIQLINGLDSIMSFLYPIAIFTKDNAPKIHSKLADLLLEISAKYSAGTNSTDILPEEKSHCNVYENTLAEITIYSKLLEMFAFIGQNHIHMVEKSSSLSSSKQQEYISKFMNICAYIDKHFAEDLTLDDIAGMSGFSKYHFSRLFHDFTNMPFYKYVNQRRISHAELLLGDPTLSVTQVAIRSGFSSQSAFIRMFKNKNGCTPTDFREMHHEFNI